MEAGLVEGDEQLGLELFKIAKAFVVPIGKLYKGKPIDVVATTDEGLAWLVYVWNKNIAREPFKTHLKTYLFDSAIKREVENLGLELGQDG